MGLKVKKSSIIQYLMLYIMICWNDTFIYNRFLADHVQIIAALLFVFALVNKKYRDRQSLLLSSFLLLVVFFLRIAFGGIGLDAWAIWTSSILITVCTFKCDTELFLERYIKLIVFLATISIVFYTMSIALPNIFQLLPLSRYRSGWTYSVWSSADSYNVYDYWNRGLLFYVSRENEYRNISIFNEPGLYQMHLNIALYIMLFLGGKININRKRAFKNIIIIIIALITCQSTSGIIGLAATVIVYIIANSKENIGVRRKILFGSMCAVTIVMVEYFINREGSILYKTIIEKIFVQSMDLNNGAAVISSGAYRLQTIIQSLKIIISYPLGCGYDILFNLLGNSSIAGATLFIDIAAIGLIPVITMLLYVFRPIIRADISRFGKFLFAFLYFNTILAQSSELYPALLVVPIYLRYVYYNKGSIVDQTKER